jgi:hypothetical protein
LESLKIISNEENEICMSYEKSKINIEQIINLFKKDNIKIIFQDYSHPEYKQCFQKDGFLSHLSIIDLLFNEGNRSKDIIMSGNLQKV